MNISSVYRLALPLGLLMLVLCSTGLAIKCYSCKDWTGQGCRTVETCPREDGCMKITEKNHQLSLYQCRNAETCKSKILKEELGLSNIQLTCCTYDLCNKGLADLPIAGLILSLSTALLALFL
ncbi:CD59 glycoprotein-like [Gastrophryne carolinensis]